MTVLAINIIDLKGNGYHAMIECAIDGIFIPMLLDTGASRTVFDREVIKKLCPEVVIVFQEQGTGLSAEKFDTFSCLIDKFQIGGIKLKNYEAVVMDLWHVNTVYKDSGLPVIGGILGNDILLHFQAEINYKNKILTLYDN